MTKVNFDSVFVHCDSYIFKQRLIYLLIQFCYINSNSISIEEYKDCDFYLYLLHKTITSL